MPLPFAVPDDADPALIFVATLTPAQRSVLCRVGGCDLLPLESLTDQQRAIADGLAASDMALLARTNGVSVIALDYDLRLTLTQGYLLTRLGERVVACLQEEG